jgi:hypothetical protein
VEVNGLVGVTPPTTVPVLPAPPDVTVPPVPGVVTTGFAKPGSVVVEGVVVPVGCARDTVPAESTTTVTRTAMLHFMP